MAHTHNIQTGEIPKPQTAAIWRTFWILLGVTAAEFIVALAIPDTIFSHSVKVVLYIGMTILKAYFIMKDFMHLGHEVKFLQASIVFPMAFIVWLLGACIWESGSLFNSHDKAKKGAKAKTSMMIQQVEKQA
jgi:heme/copper-type cytochrome/quinol oxidase subunit 4